MASPLSLARVWRILKEVDLEAIRREAENRVQLLIVGETTADADELAVWLAGDQPDPTAWMTAIDAPLAARTAPSPAGREAVVDAPDLVVAVVRGDSQSAEMKAARQAWAARNVRLVTVAVGTKEAPGKVRTQGGITRVAVARLDGEGFACVTDGVFAAVDADRRIAIARQFPVLRQKVFNGLIEETARANAGYSFSTGLAEIVPLLDIPLNIGDMLVLTKNQLMMSYRIALAAGKTGQPRELIGEIVGVLGGGLLFRQLARQLIGLLPVIGLLPKVAVAYGGTWAIGRAVALWATGGGHVTAAKLRQLSAEGLARGRAVARTMRRGTEF
jgi:uncharacterized protein (DUF697 family)